MFEEGEIEVSERQRDAFKEILKSEDPKDPSKRSIVNSTMMESKKCLCILAKCDNKYPSKYTVFSVRSGTVTLSEARSLQIQAAPSSILDSHMFCHRNILPLTLILKGQLTVCFLLKSGH